MARIRSIKPDFWTDERVLECSTNARLFFLGMWNFADDKGRIPNSPKSLKAQVFPGDSFDIETIQRMLAELTANNLLAPYSVDGRDYFSILTWTDQKIDRPQPAKYPTPLKGVAENSANARRTVSTDRIGEEGIGKDGKDTPSGPPGGGALGTGAKDNGPDVSGAAEDVDGRVKPGHDERGEAPAAAKLAAGAKADAKGGEPTPDADLFARGRAVLGKNCGGLISDLKKHFAGNVALARAAIEQASTKHDAREYVGGIIRGQRAGEARTDLVAGLWDKGI